MKLIQEKSCTSTGKCGWSLDKQCPSCRYIFKFTMYILEEKHLGKLKNNKSTRHSKDIHLDSKNENIDYSIILVEFDQNIVSPKGRRALNIASLNHSGIQNGNSLSYCRA